ncbi:hypothetical protein ASPVEDRAFT_266644 [Aspergillus versicolor CBS 583.65]|uniref:Uncharacterized protein n=1 Tax=Aspergillus versicolor CBS 583.65 TaxID=1036611 RepID=A0A1L9P6B2_ASPVE|nr:uncharacterized protein ASPVEDRAFT_266644 [Aspergillus versicolor CBS 583.65]OJI97032.1 hypothetical protein ASPVEDRAFT_266644 [Aspergillus versicolor CBS 583.65]
MQDDGVPNFVPVNRVPFTDKGGPTKAESMCRGSGEAICKKRVNQQAPLVFGPSLSAVTSSCFSLCWVNTAPRLINMISLRELSLCFFLFSFFALPLTLIGRVGFGSNDWSCVAPKSDPAFLGGRTSTGSVKVKHC